MAITTIYGGIEYRSRLEARWAAFFAGIGWHFTYEPFDGDGYIPDFLIHGDRPLLVEVKPAVTSADFSAPVQKASDGLRDHWRHDLLIVGADPLPHLEHSFDDYNPAAGLLGEFFPGDEYVPEPAWSWGTGNWFTCGSCGRIGIFHDHMSYAGRPCGHYDGDHYLRPLDPSVVLGAWGAACNDVKWRGRAAGKPAFVGLDLPNRTGLPPKRLA